MKKNLLVICIVILGAVHINAQESDSIRFHSTTVSLDSIAVKLSTLQHDYDLLYCRFELMTIRFELDNMSNDINIQSNALRINYHNARFNIDLYNSYRNAYHICVVNYNTLKEKTDSVKNLIRAKLETSSFTEPEIVSILSILELTDQKIQHISPSLEYFKAVLDAYKDAR